VKGVNGPAADRYIAAVTEFGYECASGFTTTRGLKALRDNLRMQAFEDARATLTCNHDPFKALRT
jgi:hypothetical protein